MLIATEDAVNTKRWMNALNNARQVYEIYTRNVYTRSLWRYDLWL